MEKQQILSVLVCALLAARAVSAEVVSIGPCKDTSLYSEVDILSNGSGSHCFAGRVNFTGGIRRALLAFDIAGHVPAGATIDYVVLTLHVSRTGAGPVPVTLHRLLLDWGEAGSDAEGQEGAGTVAEPGDATWSHAVYETVPWGNPGGDYVPVVSASTMIGGLGFCTWQSGGLVADVQFMLDNPGRDFGWVVVGDETTNRTTKRFDARENAFPSFRPLLKVTYTASTGAGACCFADTSCAKLPPDDCASQSGVFQGAGVTCTLSLCVKRVGACCFGDGSCVDATSDSCVTQGGIYQGEGTACVPNQCPQVTGACCFADASCQLLASDGCAVAGGVYQGDATECAPNLCSVKLAPYVDALPIPPVMPPQSGVAGGVAHYDISMTQFQQQLHRDLPPTTVWGYNGSYPAATIEAGMDLPITVTWINDLRDESGQLRTDHYLPVDLCPHGPDHLGPTPRAVVHLHGGHVPPEFDGYPEDTILPGESVTYEFPNNQLPTTLWYHDHALGITRLNVIMGMAGFYLIRDPFEEKLGLPSGEFEIPIVIQDRSFNADGTWQYPADWQDHFFGDTILVNGKVWPFLEVKRGHYRFRLLNGSNSRTYHLSFSNGLGFHQIGTDGGLLPAPVALTEVTLGPAERADVIIDFSSYPAGTEILVENDAPSPFPGSPGVGVIPNIMKFIVTDQLGGNTPVPGALRPIETLSETDSVQSRDFLLRQASDPCTGNVWLINDLVWDDITEYPELGTTEIWRFANGSGIMHPMHMHLVMFQVLDRQPFTVVDGEIVPTGAPVSPDENEQGWKDTVKVNPLEITRVIARFDDYTGKYAYHCHIIEHEDHEMMRQFQVVLHGDYDEDSDVDLADFALWTDCMTGPNQSPFPEGCHAFDFDYDMDVDYSDFGAFQRAFTTGGP